MKNKYIGPLRYSEEGGEERRMGKKREKEEEIDSSTL
jgi:hypothetical protein